MYEDSQSHNTYTSIHSQWWKPAEKSKRSERETNKFDVQKILQAPPKIQEGLNDEFLGSTTCLLSFFDLYVN